jgi:integrase/recombinase XerD
MDQSSQGISPLRQRMMDDMRMRKLSPKTQSAYIRAVRQLARFLGRSPDAASVEDLRRYQLHLVDHGADLAQRGDHWAEVFFEVTLGNSELMAKMQPVRVPRTLPVVLSREEVARLIAATGNLKHQTALSVAYGAGLRASEVVALKVGDIDSQRMTLRIEQGKGHKDRYAMLPPVLLERLRIWWRVARAPGQDARWRLAVSRAQPGRVTEHPPAQSGRACCGEERADRQARFDAHVAALSTLPDYVE